MAEPDLTPLAAEIASIINAHRLVTDVELQISVEGKAKNVSDAQAIQWLAAMHTALAKSCMRLAGEVDHLTARIEALEGNEESAV